MNSTFGLSLDESVLFGMDWRVIRRWDLKAGRELPAPPGYSGWVTFTPAADGRHLFAGDSSGGLDEWDLTTGKKVRALSGESNESHVEALAASPDGKWLAVGQFGRGVQLWEVSTGKLAHEFRPDPVRERRDRSTFQVGVAFGPDGRVLYLQADTGDMAAWDLATRKKLWQVEGDGSRLAVDPKGRWVATCAALDGKPPVHWTARDAKTGAVVGHAESKWGGAEDLVFSADGAWVITSDYSAVHVWDAETRREVRTLPVGSYRRIRVSCSPDSKWIALGDEKLADAEKPGVSVWELATGKQLITFDERHDGNRSAPAFTRDGRGLITNPDLSPVLWDLCPKDLPRDGLWEMLAETDGAKAYKAQWALIRDPAAAVKLFGAKVKPAELGVRREQFDKWVADLDSPQFRTREAAEKELATAGGRVPIGWLRKALADAKADEPRARLGRVLTKRERDPDPDAWRLSRAVQVLELAGTAEARALLKTWAAVEGSPVGTIGRGLRP